MGEDARLEQGPGRDVRERALCHQSKRPRGRAAGAGHGPGELSRAAEDGLRGLRSELVLRRELQPVVAVRDADAVELLEERRRRFASLLRVAFFTGHVCYQRKHTRNLHRIHNHANVGNMLH